MRFTITLLALLSSCFAFSQKKDFTIHNISLPSELSWYDNQFSGLYIHEGKLFLMSESRLQDNAEPKLYTINIADLERKLKDTSFVLPYKKIHIYNLQILRDKMKAAGDDYEGLEAITIDKNNIYLSVETATPSNNCYIIKGELSDTAVIMQVDHLYSLVKPVDNKGEHIYNAGYEAMSVYKEHFVAFFEYNYFANINYAKLFNLERNGDNFSDISMERLPFRITDITSTGNFHFTGINYFYRGEGDDEIYRVQNSDHNSRLIKDSAGYHNYCRLIDLTVNNREFTWKTIWEFPKEYSNYNWEGIAAYKKGYFIINDKYTPARPYASTLLYLEKK